MYTNTELINKAIQTSSFSGGGLLNPGQAKKFLLETFEKTNLNGLVRHEMRVEKTGEIDKLGIASHLLREKTENTDDGYRAGVYTSQIKYATTAVRLPWEITEETLRENIEGQSLEGIITSRMTTRIGTDCEDLYLNGDEDMGSTPDFSASTAYNKGDKVLKDDLLYQFTADHAAGAWTGTDAEEIGTKGDVLFYKVNDGWIKQIKNGGHIYDASSDTEPMSLDMFYNALAALPNKYNNGNLRWLMSPRRAQQWSLYLLNKVIKQGGIVPENIYTAPARVPVIECPAMSDDKILLVDPKNFIIVNTYSMQIRKTVEGKEAIMQDKRFYVVHFDFDPIIEELDATAIITGIR